MSLDLARVASWVSRYFWKKGEPLFAATVRALGSAGLELTDDAGNVGLFVADGGNVTTYKAFTIWGAGAYNVAGAARLDLYNTTWASTWGLHVGNTGTIQLFSGDGNTKFTIASGANGRINFYTGTDLTVFNDAIYVNTDCSAATFTDRTKGYVGDALAELAGIKAKDGTLDHTTLPEFARSADGEGRDLGAMISLLTVAVQQLTARIEKLEGN